VAQAAHHRAPAPATDTPASPVSCLPPSLVALLLSARPHPSAHAPLPRDRPLSGRRAPPVSSLPSLVICNRRDHRRPEPRLIASPLLLPSEPWRLAALSLAPASSYPVTPLCPSHPIATVRHFRRRGKRCRCAPPHPPSPSRPPIKGLPRAPDSTTLGLSHSTFLPQTQSSSPPSSLPSPVSSALPPLLSSSQISVVVDLRHFNASMTHPFPSPIAPLASPATSPPRAPATAPWTGHPRHPPAKLALHHDPLPPPVPRHHSPVAEPEPRRRTAAGLHRRSSPGWFAPPHHRSTPSAPLPLARGPTPMAPSPHRFPLAGLVGHLPARALALGWAKFPPPPTQLAENLFSFSFFHFFFPFSYIYLYTNILCTKNSLNKL
jgi:hypothetical protein